MNYLTLILPFIFAGLIIAFFIYWARAVFIRKKISKYNLNVRPHFELPQDRFPMERKDLLPVCIITVVYAAIAFVALGATNAPHSPYRFTEAEEAITIDMGTEHCITSVRYYSGLHHGWYSIEFSANGTDWETVEYTEQGYADLFKWLDIELSCESYNARYVRIGAWSAPLEMNELALYDDNGALIDTYGFLYSTDGIVFSSDSAVSTLFDEQELVEEQTYFNSMYFDEIYHGRTALEHIRGYEPYEVSHPPLGKIIISIGIRLFGMVPFGWRFMGTLFGIIMLPIFYVFIKNLFGKTIVASCGTLLFAFDFMHFVQTRIATIDTYGVFFIILMYFFMYRYISSGYDAPFKKTALPLFLSGLFFGIGAACKWTVIYGAPGLLALYIIYQVFRARHCRRNNLIGKFKPYFIKTLLFSILFFIIVPCLIYYLSYIPYGLANGQTLSDGMLWSKQYAKTVWDNQVFMLTYHSGVHDTHPYSSRWYTWLLDIRPILYYISYLGPNTKSSFAAFGNPMLWWGGLIAMITTGFEFFKNRSSKALFILIGYLSMLLPWMFITRTVFIYHYFPSTIFLTLALCYVFNTLIDKKGRQGHNMVMLYTMLALLLFVLFYPVLTGIPFSGSYTDNWLRWIYATWPF